MTITVNDLTIPEKGEFTRNAPIRGNPELRQFNKFVNSVYARNKQVIFGHCYPGVTAEDTFKPIDTGTITQTNGRPPGSSRHLFEFHAIWDGEREDLDGQYRILLEVFGRDIQTQVEFVNSGLTLDVTCGPTYDFVKTSGQLDLLSSLPEIVRFFAATDGDEGGTEDLVAWAVSYEYLTGSNIP